LIQAFGFALIKKMIEKYKHVGLSSIKKEKRKDE
jgi:hypothetical protein